MKINSFSDFSMGDSLLSLRDKVTGFIVGYSSEQLYRIAIGSIGYPRDNKHYHFMADDVENFIHYRVVLIEKRIEEPESE